MTAFEKVKPVSFKMDEPEFRGVQKLGFCGKSKRVNDFTESI